MLVAFFVPTLLVGDVMDGTVEYVLDPVDGVDGIIEEPLRGVRVEVDEIVEGDRGELFFHHSEVNGVPFEQLREGQMVEYEIGQGRKGPCLIYFCYV